VVVEAQQNSTVSKLKPGVPACARHHEFTTIHEGRGAPPEAAASMGHSQGYEWWRDPLFAATTDHPMRRLCVARPSGLSHQDHFVFMTTIFLIHPTGRSEPMHKAAQRIYEVDTTSIAA